VSPADRTFWMSAHRRAAGLQPDVQSAILRAFQIIRESMTDAELARIIASGNLDLLFQRALTEAVLDRAFLPVRQRIRAVTGQGFKFATASLPRGGKVNGTIVVMFDVLSPDVIEAVRALDTRVVGDMKAEIRETARQVWTEGLTSGANPRETARRLRSTVGIGPSQEQAIQNFRQVLLDAGDSSKALSYQLRDKRFDATIKAARASGGSIPMEKVDRMVEVYRKRTIAFNAETNARTATLDSFKAGQSASWEQAAAAGIVDRSRLMKTWVGVMDSRERPEHVAMQGETVHFDSPYSNGEMNPGDSTYNCRCVSRVFVGKVPLQAAA
jgi:hypothetical protein